MKFFDALKPALTAAGVAVATGFLVAPAMADVDHPVERTGDVFHYRQGTAVADEGRSTDIDLIDHRVRHHSKTVKIESVYADLRKPRGSEEISMFTSLLTRDGEYDVTVSATREDPKGVVGMYTSGPFGTDVVDCAGLQGRFDYDTDTVSISVPRSCLGKPAWIRYFSEAALALHNGKVTYYDIAGRRAGGGPLDYSRKLYKH
jgi:hypothetical protein